MGDLEPAGPHARFSPGQPTSFPLAPPPSPPPPPSIPPLSRPYPAPIPPRPPILPLTKGPGSSSMKMARGPCSRRTFTQVWRRVRRG